MIFLKSGKKKQKEGHTMKPRTHCLCSFQQYCKVDGIRHALRDISRSALQDFKNLSYRHSSSYSSCISKWKASLPLSYIYNTSNTYFFSMISSSYSHLILLNNVFFHLGWRNPFIHARVTSTYTYILSVQSFPCSVRYLHHAVYVHLGSTKKRPKDLHTYTAVWWEFTRLS